MEEFKIDFDLDPFWTKVSGDQTWFSDNQELLEKKLQEIEESQDWYNVKPLWKESEEHLQQIQDSELWKQYNKQFQLGEYRKQKIGINKYENERNHILEEEVQRRVRERTMEIAKGMNKWVKRMKEYYIGQIVRFISNYWFFFLSKNKRL